jgi:uncharacterized protein YdeI (YjbR/CyaY-like superfamily)
MTDDPLSFARADALWDWLSLHHATAPALWLRLWKKDSGTPSVTWEECVVAALAHGWIDGLKRPGDERSWLQRISPRKPRSAWSQKNRAHAERLIAEGRMQPAGLAQVLAAKADGRWDAAYAGSATMEIPQDFLDALAADAAAQAFYATLDRKNLFPIYYRLHTAKRPETRAARIAAMVAQLSRGERFQ